jgi:hypothetical protein
VGNRAEGFARACAKIINSVGLIFDIIGIILLFVHDYKKINNNFGDEPIGGWPQKIKDAEKRFSIKGLFLIVIGFLLQLISNWFWKSLQEETMSKLSDADVFVIETLAIYSVMDMLEQDKIIDKEMLISYFEKLSEIQRQIVNRFIEEKTERTKSMTNLFKGGKIKWRIKSDAPSP